jgi:hypothetical protein
MAQIRSRVHVDAANKRGQGVSGPARADQPGPEAETRVRGKRERRLDLDRRVGIRSAQIKSKPPDLGWTPEIKWPGADMGVVAPLGPAARAH